MADNLRPDPSEQELGAALHRLAATGGAAAQPWSPESVRNLGQRRQRRRAAGVAAGTTFAVAAAGGIAYGTGALGTDPGPTTVAAAPTASPARTHAAAPRSVPPTTGPSPSPSPGRVTTPSVSPTSTPAATQVPPPQTPPPTPDPFPTPTMPPPDPMPLPLSAFLRAKGMTATLAPWRVIGTADNAMADAPASRCLQRPSPDLTSHAYERDFATDQTAADDGAEIIVPSGDAAAATAATARLTRWFDRCLVGGQEAGQTGDTIVDQPLRASYGAGARVIGLTFPSTQVPDAVPTEYAAYGRGGPDGNTVVVVVVRYTGQDVLDPTSTVVDPLRRALARIG